MCTRGENSPFFRDRHGKNKYFPCRGVGHVGERKPRTQLQGEHPHLLIFNPKMRMMRMLGCNRGARRAAWPPRDSPEGLRLSGQEKGPLLNSVARRPPASGSGSALALTSDGA